MFITGTDTVEEAVDCLKDFRIEPLGSKITCPFLIMHGANDRQVPLADAERMLDVIASADKELKIFDGDNGGSAHTQFNNHRPALHYAADWLAEKLGKRRGEGAWPLARNDRHNREHADVAFSVDFGFIRQLEGELILSGYVPEPDLSHSGVTIGSGIDLGQRDEESLRALGVPDDLCERLRPYFGLKKFEAVAALERAPLEITLEEAEILDHAVVGQILTSLAAKFDEDSDTPFQELDSGKQTVVASVAFQYGTDLRGRTPNFWHQVTTGDWDSALANLRDFGDAYPTRRNKEARLLNESMTA